MAARERDDDKPFLSRWSQRKRQAEEETRVAEVTAVSEAEPEAEPAEIDPAELPDIDSLEAGSDFSVFLRKGVPNALKQKALRRLWQVDPAFKHICMLDDYNQDFTDAAMVVPNLKTVYQVGRGMVLPEDELETTGRRALLNLGHTFAHALEAETGCSDVLLHGEAVALGLVLAFRFSAERGLCSAADAERVAAHLAAVGLPTRLEFGTGASLTAHMASDKKAEGGRIPFILARGIGEAFVAADVALDEVADFLDRQR